jgi:transglutaminase-like putative cysteine protease
MRVQYFGVLSGESGTRRTIDAMQRLVREGRIDPTIIYTAQQLVRNIPRNDFRSQASALHEFVKRYVGYVRDPRSTELLRSPFWTLYYQAGDCDDQAVLLCALAEAIGLKTRFKTIKADATFPDEFSHVYGQIQMPDSGEWITSDTIVPGATIGWEAEERFGSRTWGGMGGMSLGAEATATSGPTFMQSLGNAFTGLLVQATPGLLNQWGVGSGTTSTSTTPRPAAAAGGLPSWLLPAGAVAGVGALVIFLKTRRRA